MKTEPKEAQGIPRSELNRLKRELTKWYVQGDLPRGAGRKSEKGAFVSH